MQKFRLLAVTSLIGFLPSALWGVPPEDSLNAYKVKILKAHNYIDDHAYLKGARTFQNAFKMRNEVSNLQIFFAASAWACAKKSDTALQQLSFLARKRDFSRVNKLVIDPCMQFLKTNSRFQQIKAKIKANRREKLGKLDSALLAQLDTIYRHDQHHRQLMDYVAHKYGNNSDTLKKVWMRQSTLDSQNKAKVQQILKNHGWPSPKAVGENASEVVFLVLQHADQYPKWQKQQLPLVRQAVKKGKIDSADLAMFIDRVAVNNDQKQIYGTQIGTHDRTGQHYVKPVKNPLTLEKRRKKMGLPPMDWYLSNWDLEWDPIAYKQNLSQYLQWKNMDK
jgi:hypothetical protein